MPDEIGLRIEVINGTGVTGMRRVVCAVDGSPEALEAANQAHALAGDDAAFLCASAWDPSLAMHAGLQATTFAKQLRDTAVEALEGARAAIPAAETTVVRGPELAAILQVAARHEADLIAVGMTGRSRVAGVALGSVATGVVHYAPCSVLVGRAAPDGFPGAILHPTDGSPSAQEAAAMARDLGERAGAEVTVLAVGAGDEAGAAAEAAREASGAGRVVVREGDAADVIAEVATQERAALIVMGSRGVTGLRSLGSVSERVAHGAPCSVLIVRDASHPAPDDGAD